MTITEVQLTTVSPTELQGPHRTPSQPTPASSSTSKGLGTATHSGQRHQFHTQQYHLTTFLLFCHLIIHHSSPYLNCILSFSQAALTSTGPRSAQVNLTKLQSKLKSAKIIIQHPSKLYLHTNTESNTHQVKTSITRKPVEIFPK